jgi:hypothetical protein
MIEFLNFGNDATYRIFDWIVKTFDVDAMISTAKEKLVSEVDKAEWPTLFGDEFAMAEALSEVVDEKIELDLQSEAERHGLDIETWFDENGQESVLSALIGVSLSTVSSQIVAKALLIKSAGWKPSMN